MRVFAYCALELKDVVRRAAGVSPLTCPPVAIDSFDPSQMSGQDFLYFNLDGLPDEPYWYGDGYETAMALDQIASVDLAGAVVFVANCYLPESPFLQTLLDAGAGYVAGGAGENYSRRSRVGGADTLGLWFRRLLSLGMSPPRAFGIARARVALSVDRAMKDAAQFKIWSV